MAHLDAAPVRPDNWPAEATHGNCLLLLSCKLAEKHRTMDEHGCIDRLQQQAMTSQVFLRMSQYKLSQPRGDVLGFPTRHASQSGADSQSTQVYGTPRCTRQRHSEVDSWAYAQDSYAS